MSFASGSRPGCPRCGRKPPSHKLHENAVALHGEPRRSRAKGYFLPAISAASIQVSFLAMAFKITSCSFIIRSVSRAGIGWFGSTPPASYLPALDRTTHVLITPDNSHANERGFLSTGKQARKCCKLGA